MEKLLTLCIVHINDSVLLGMKKRGFGIGRWNGFGGKVNKNESIEQAARREIFEEAHIKPHDMKKLGILQFHFVDQTDVLVTHVYKCTAYTGTPGESEEMKPQWFSISEIPFTNMWKDDVFWFPYFLKNELFKGKFIFDTEHNILESNLQKVETL